VLPPLPSINAATVISFLRLAEFNIRRPYQA
jgi:hypothetical protein